MSRNTRRIIRRSPLVALVGLTNNQVEEMSRTHLITRGQDIATLEKEDFDTVLGMTNETFLFQRHLYQISQFLQKGGTLQNDTSFMEILTFINTPPPIASQGRSSTSSSPIKLSPSDVPEFSGNIRDEDKY